MAPYRSSLAAPGRGEMTTEDGLDRAFPVMQCICQFWEPELALVMNLKTRDSNEQRCPSMSTDWLPAQRSYKSLAVGLSIACGHETPVSKK